jgi:hypothetical protein
MRIRLALIWSVLITTSATAEFWIQSGPKQVPLVELYTSEGCSSCPPADAWMAGLKDQPGLWKDFVPVAFHVDYWDRLGWKDRFARATFTGRQQDHARALNADNIYTPAFFLAGKEWLGWRSRKRPPITRRAMTGVLTVRSVDHMTVTVTFTPSSSARSPLMVRVAVLGFNQSTSVARGENRGQTLHHDFVVLSYQSATLETIDPKTLSSTVARGDVPAGKERRALAVWIEREDDPTPIQAVGGWLEPEP